MPNQRIDARVGARLGSVVPDLDSAVAAAGDEAAAGHRRRPIRGAGHRGGRRGGRPRHRVRAQRVRRQLRGAPLVVAQLQQRHGAVGRRGGEHAASLGRRPRHDVDGCRVPRVVVGLGPAAGRGRAAGAAASGALAPHDDPPVVAAAREQRAELRVRPRHAPHRAAVALQRVRQPVRWAVGWALQRVDLHRRV